MGTFRIEPSKFFFKSRLPVLLHMYTPVRVNYASKLGTYISCILSNGSLSNTFLSDVQVTLFKELFPVTQPEISNLRFSQQFSLLCSYITLLLFHLYGTLEL